MFVEKKTMLVSKHNAGSLQTGACVAIEQGEALGTAW
jgi:hypothetical protein